MKSSYLLPAFVALLLTGCVRGMRLMAVYLQNTTMQSVTARLSYGKKVDPAEGTRWSEQSFFAQGLRYSPRLEPPRKNYKRLRDTLSVSATDTAATFVLPAHSTVLLYVTIDRYAYRDLKKYKLYLQPAGAPTRVLTADSIWQKGHVRRGGGF
jgi:hypothetical protein